MGSSPNIDLDALIAPISEEAPTGVAFDKADADSQYYRVKEQRDTAKNNEELALEALMFPEGAPDYDTPNWKVVVESAASVLAEHSKDFRIVCWLAEALVREHGYSGLRDGLVLCQKLCDQYWDALYPPPNPEDGHGERVAMLNALTSDTAIRSLKQSPITGAVDGIRYSVIDYSLTGEQEESGDEDSGPRTKQYVSHSEFQQAVMAADAEHYRNLLADLDESIEVLVALTAFLDEHCLPDEYDEPTAPSTTALRNELEDARRIVSAISRPLLGEEESVTEDGEEAGSTEATGEGGSRGPIASREDAFRQLQKVADFFERTEPHSPISYALKQVIGWGRMSLPELLRDLIGDESVRDDLSRRVGVPISRSDSDD